jgi:hypothetical protein
MVILIKLINLIFLLFFFKTQNMLTRAQKKHQKRSERRKRNHCDCLLRCKCKFTNGLISYPCDGHLPILTDVEIMILGNCPRCNVSLISWHDKELYEFGPKKNKCICQSLGYEREYIEKVMLTEKSKSIIILAVPFIIVDKNRSILQFLGDLCFYNHVSFNSASKRIMINLSAFIRTEYGWENKGLKKDVPWKFPKNTPLNLSEY